MKFLKCVRTFIYLKLEKILINTGIVVKVHVTLGRVGGSHDVRLRDIRRMRTLEDAEKGSVTSGARGDKANAATVLGEHVLANQKVVKHRGHPFQFMCHEIGEIVIEGGTTSETKFTTVVAAETPKRVNVTTIVHALFGKTIVPGTDAKVGVIRTGKSGLGEFLFIEISSMDEKSTIRGDNVVNGFEVVEITQSVRSRDDRTED